DLDEVGRVGIFLLRSDIPAAPHNITETEIGPMTTTPTKLATATGANPYAFCVNSTTGDDGAAPVPFVPIAETEGTELFYDWTPIAPGDAASDYTTNLNAIGAPLVDGEYYVYVGIDDAAGAFGAAEVLYRAPGTLTLSGMGGAGAERTFRLSPSKLVPSEGDLATVRIYAIDYGADADMADIYVGIPKAYFNVSNSGTPCTLSATLTGLGGYSLAMNETIDDAANNRWIVHCTLWNGSTDFGALDIDAGGLATPGTEIANFQIACLGTTDAVESPASMIFLQDPGNGWETRYELDGAKIPPAGVGNAQIMVQPRTILEGVVQFEGRDDVSNALVTLELRERGSYEIYSDTTFELNDDDAASGVQIQLDDQGKFQLVDVPTGDWDMVLKYDRYLAVLQEVTTGPGIDNTLVDFGLMRGGDVTGYTDAGGNDLPNNAINQDDVDKIVSALGKTSASAGWGAPDNDQYCDINEDDVVSIADLSMATANWLGVTASTGAQPVFLKPAVSPEMGSNLEASVEFINLPSEFKAGEQYTIQIIVNDAADVKGYFVNLEYDKNALTFNGITKGDFISSKSATRSLIEENLVGFANAVYGTPSFDGDGILAEVTFTANMDTAFPGTVLGIKETAFVNSRFLEENLEFSGMTFADISVPASFNLGQNFPNPFNPTTSINFSVPATGNVTINVYDILGHKITTLVDGNYSAGNHTVVWNATDMTGKAVSAGVYFYTIESNNFFETKRMLFMK
ncbi:cohesin domain-containing protein, partial [Candidatus Latescibacterota bacterium]